MRLASPYGTDTEPARDCLHPLDREHFPAFASLPPAVSAEILIRRSHYVEFNIGRSGVKDSARAPRVVVARDQVHGMHLTFAQLGDDRCNFLRSGFGIMRECNEIALREVGLHSKRNREIALVEAVQSGGAADQCLWHIAFPHQFGAFENSITIEIAR